MCLPSWITVTRRVEEVITMADALPERITRVVVSTERPVLIDGPVDIELPDGGTASSQRVVVASCTCRHAGDVVPRDLLVHGVGFDVLGVGEQRHDVKAVARTSAEPASRWRLPSAPRRDRTEAGPSRRAIFSSTSGARGTVIKRRRPTSTTRVCHHAR